MAYVVYEREVIMEALKLDKKYTYSDYCTWDDDQRWELIDGVPYAMSPAPSKSHQDITGELFWQIKNYLKNKSCEVFIAPFDVRLNFDKEDNTVVQPDVLIVCNKDKLNDKGVLGAPDFVAEVLSPSTSKKDMILKYNAYLNAGVKEYWIIDPVNKFIMANILRNDNYEGKPYFSDDNEIKLTVLDDCKINLNDLFSTP